MAFAIIRAAKQKGGSVAASGQHNDRTRETPNADKEKKAENKLLIGDDRNVREIVTEIIDDHGGRPRIDSVEAVELLMTASHEYFTDGRQEIIPERVDAFVEKGIKFLEEKANFGICAKADLHMDERTPHIHAHMVPIDPKGKLNCKYFMGGRDKLTALQDRYYEVMSPLGLERGERGSRATHTDIKKFYGAITRDHVLKIDIERLPDPPRLIPSKDSIEKYKKSVVVEIHRQTAEPLKTLHQQSMLAREERARRETSERISAAKVAEAERGRADADRRTLLEQVKFREYAVAANKLLERHDMLEKKAKDLEKQLAAERQKTQEQSARVTDIRMSEVMDKLNYYERDKSTYTYRDTQGRVALAIPKDNTLRNSTGEVICSNSIDLVIRMEKFQGRTITESDAMIWLSKTFGEERAMAAVLVMTEQRVPLLFEQRREQEREHQKAIELERQPATRAQEPTHKQEREPKAEREEYAHIR